MPTKLEAEEAFVERANSTVVRDSLIIRFPHLFFLSSPRSLGDPLYDTPFYNLT
jgi:hypothetical protein